MLKLIQLKGEQVYINVDSILAIEPYNKGTVITCPGANEYASEGETPVEFIERLKVLCNE